jgi:hypothetical protein
MIQKKKGCGKMMKETVWRDRKIEEGSRKLGLVISGESDNQKPHVRPRYDDVKARARK